jgi:hypothetical protein
MQSGDIVVNAYDGINELMKDKLPQGKIEND